MLFIWSKWNMDELICLQVKTKLLLDLKEKKQEIE